MSKIEAQIEAARARFDAEITAIAADVRERLVVPACRKYNLEYQAGNGTYAFFRAGALARNMGGAIGSAWDAEQARIPLKRVFAALDLEITHGQYLGYYVDDVRLEGSR